MNKTGKTQSPRASKIAALQAEINELKSLDASSKADTKVQMDDLIPVMSLLPYTLNLSTRDGGQGSVRKFSRFGEIKQILYHELIDIMENHPNFLNAGYFYIMSPAVIRTHGLQEVYEKILTKEKLDEIIALDSEECATLFASCNPGQQEVIVQLLVDKVRDGTGIDLNIVDKISRLSKVDIVARAESEKEIAQAEKE